MIASSDEATTAARRSAVVSMVIMRGGYPRITDAAGKIDQTQPCLTEGFVLRSGWMGPWTVANLELPRPIAYVVALAVSVLMLSARAAFLEEWLGSGSPFIQSYPALVVAALFGGTGPG